MYHFVCVLSRCPFAVLILLLACKTCSFKAGNLSTVEQREEASDPLFRECEDGRHIVRINKEISIRHFFFPKTGTFIYCHSLKINQPHVVYSFQELGYHQLKQQKLILRYLQTM